MVQGYSGFQLSDRPIVLFLVVSTIALLSRLPFLDAGYGNDWDSWAMASTAREIATTGTYTASRLPGYPVPEFIYSFVWDRAPLLSNVMTALIGAIGIGFFSLSLHKLHSKDILTASFALMCIPVIYISSTVTLDYIWAATFFLASMYFAQRSNPLTSGVLLGLAIGSRITSALLVIPLALIAFDCSDQSNRRSVLIKFCLPAIFLGMLSYLPVVLTYGGGFLTVSSSGYPPLLGVLRVFTFEVWGGLGIIALGIAIIGFLDQRFRLNGETSILTISKMQALAWNVAILLYLVIFFYLPHEAGYLIPALPFVLMLLARYLKRNWFVAFCGILMFSPFFLSVSSNNLIDITGIQSFSKYAIRIEIPGNQVIIDPLYGPVISDYRQRVNGMAYAERVVAATKQLDIKSVVVVGAWLPKIQIISGNRAPVDFIYLVESEDILHQYRLDGIQIYYLPGQLEYNQNLYGINLQEFGAVQLEVER